MTHSRSYPVTMEDSLPQPHVKFDTKPSNSWTCSGWLPFVTAGALALTLLICLHLLGGDKLFPRVKDPSVGLIPINKQGSLQIYPFLSGTGDGTRTQYSVHLPAKNLNRTKIIMNNLLKGYPQNHTHLYKNCWLENPSPSKPCFFDSSWIADVCTKDNYYGYEENNGYLNPCFIMKFDKTNDWIPSSLSREGIPPSIADHFDPGFMPVLCAVAKDINQLVNITVYPPKGFSLLFFPVSQFDSKRYLAPLVAVKVNNIEMGQNVTIECSVVTPNAFSLWNIGKVIIHFTSDISSPLRR